MTDEQAERLAELLAKAQIERDDNAYYSGGKPSNQHLEAFATAAGQALPALLSQRAADKATIAIFVAAIERRDAIIHQLGENAAEAAKGYAAEIARLEALLAGRDSFIVHTGMWGVGLA